MVLVNVGRNDSQRLAAAFPRRRRIRQPYWRQVPSAESKYELVMARERDKNPTYCFIDVDVRSRQIIGWGTETKDKVEVHLTTGYHRVFLTTGQYNKLERKLRERK